MRERYAQIHRDGILLFIRLTPNARKDEVLGRVEGTDGPLIAAKVHAIPDKGKANKALIALIAKWLGLAKSEISLKSGSKSRLKTLLINGTTDELLAALDQVVGALEKELR
jgi:uncharacterized protein (TIGR00251 family)